MYKIMIVDDEWLVQEGIKVTLENNFSNIEIVGMASTGREAIEMQAEKYPDIILMDIKMPGINGIEAIQSISKRFDQTKFVIISAYEQFEYAQQAVELGVVDYILKPINKDKLVGAVQKCMDAIESQRIQRHNIIRSKEKLEQMMPVLEKGFIYSLLLNSNFKQELKKYKDLFEIKKEHGFAFVLEVVEEDENITNDIRSDYLYPKIQSGIKYKCKCVVGPMIINKITVVVIVDEESYEYDSRLKAIKICDNIQESLRDVQLKIGIGSTTTIDNIQYSLEEATYALNKVNTEKALHYNDITEDKNSLYTHGIIKAQEVELLKYVENGQLTKIQETYAQLMDQVKHLAVAEVDVKNIIIELMVMVTSLCYRHQLNESEANYASYLSEIKQMDALNELENWTLRRMLYVSEIIESKRNSHVSNIILRAKTYIDENYEHDIGLNDVSKEVAISPQYFSTVFKEELGVNFVEYLRNKRVAVAKELLRSKKYSVKEICYKIGYNDPNYFSRLFKKLVGVSPTEFK